MHTSFNAADSLLVWRKAKTRSESKSKGPFRVWETNGRIVTIADYNGEPGKFNAAGFKAYASGDEPRNGPKNGQAIEIMAWESQGEFSVESEVDDVVSDPNYELYEDSDENLVQYEVEND